MESNLNAIAESRWRDPLNTWPDHNRYHSRTILGNWLFDYACLRCWLERVATEQLAMQKKHEGSADVIVEEIKH